MKKDEVFLELFDKIILTIKRYLSENSYELPIVSHHSPDELSNKINLTLPKVGGGNEMMINCVDLYLKYCVRTAHPQFFNQLWSGFDNAGFIGEILTALTNTSMYTYEVAPMATLIEMKIIKKLVNLIGLPEEAGGTFVTGGSNGNLLGMLLARDKALSAGHKLEDLYAFYSENSHYSLDTAAMVLGISKSHTIKIPSDSHHRMNATILRQKIEEITALKKVPFFVCATAGTTIAGAFDSILDIANITYQQNNCWFHVDAAHGGSVLFSEQSKYLLNGIEFADSVVLDAHKALGAPLTCSILLVKDKDLLNFHQSNKEASDYLFHLEDKDIGAFNLGTSSLQCGRRADCIKLWLMWNKYGTEGFENRVNKLIALARYAEKKVESSSSLTLAIRSEYINVCFYYNLQTNLLNSDQFHKKIKESLYKKGLTMVNTASVSDKVCIRLVISNPELNNSDIDIFFENVLETARFIEKSNNNAI